MGFTGSLITVLSVSAISLLTIYTQDFEWSSVGFTDVANSPKISALTLCIFRLIFASIVWITIYSTVTDEGIKIEVIMRDGRKKPLQVKYMARLTFFTYWCWLLQGVYFLLTGILSGISASDIKIESILNPESIDFFVKMSWVLYEVNFAVAYLVTVVVSFVLIPTHIKEGISTELFFRIIALFTHNANVAFMAFELIFNGMTFSFWHFIYAVLFGLSYTLFSWYLYSKIGVFYYFFLDYDRKDSVFLYLALMFTLTTFFFFGYGISYLEHHFSWAPWIVAALTVLIMKIFK